MKRSTTIQYSTFLLAAVVLLLDARNLAAQVAVPASFAHPKAEADTSKKGFRVRVVQVEAALNGRVSGAEAALAGTLLNSTGQPLPNVADLSSFGVDGYYNEENVVDYEESGASLWGLVFPGIPGTTDSYDNFAVEAVAYLDLSPGEYTMGVNSDDGFRVTVGPDARDQFSAIEVGAYDATRGAGDSIFRFTISEAGLYSFRLVYFEVGGGANVTWFMGDSKDAGVLINDPNDPASVKAYRELTTGSAPFIQLLEPGVGATAASPTAAISGVIADGSAAQVTASSVELYLDGAKVNANAQKSGSKTSFSYQPETMFRARSTHQVKLIFADSTSTVRTNEYEFTVKEFIDVTLPTPFYLETFDALEEGTLPTGWTAEYLSAEPSGFEDLSDPRSDSFLTWVVISRERLAGITAFTASQRLEVSPGQFVNGKEVTSLINTNFIYAESDVRSGSQVQYLFTADIDCTGKSNVFVVFNSIYTQNQDNLGSLEYSIDSGATWLPILYMVEEADVKKDAEGNIDGYATLSAEQTDTASLTDPNTFEEIGLHYGAFIGVTSNLWSTLAPYISARVNDDQVESKRVEMYRLDKADGQANVRFRFAQAGTASWFFGIDELGLYEIVQALPPKITEQPQSQIVSAGGTATLSVAASGDDLRYQWKLNDTAIAGATGATLTLSNLQAANAGDYTVVVSNDGGEAVSTTATLEVFAGAVTQDLVVHLKFDDNLNDASGKGNNGTAVGAPGFAAGKIGQAVHVPSGADYVSLGAPADLNFGADTDFSIALWALLKEWDGDPSLIGNKNWGSGGNQGYVLAADDDGHFQWNLAGAPGSRKDYDGAAGALSNGWHHVVVTFTRTGNAATYIDGLEVNSKSIAADQNNIDTPAEMATNVGQDGTGAYGSAFIDADFDDLGIWRRALTAQEVAAIYAAGQQGKDLATAVVSGGGPGELPTISVARSATGITLTYTGTLQSAEKVEGPYSDVTGAASPHDTAATGATRFFKVVME